jgi:hypothetical protein
VALGGKADFHSLVGSSWVLIGQGINRTAC